MNEEKTRAKDLAVEAFEAISRAFEENRDLLTRLDADLGDGDLGRTMAQGFRASLAGLRASAEGLTPAELLFEAGMSMAEGAPSTMGTLMSIGLIKAGEVIKSGGGLDGRSAAAMMRTAAEGIAARGGARRGDKTLLDALLPAAEACSAAAEAGAGLGGCLRRASEAAWAGVEFTKALASVHGKAGVFGEATVGKQDPGATAVAVLVGALAGWAEAEKNPFERKRI